MKSIFSLFVAFLLVLVTFDEALAKGSSGGRGGFSSSRSSSSFSSSRSSYSGYSSSRSSSSSTSSSNAFSKSSTQSYTTPKWAAPAPKVVPVPKPTPTPKFVTTTVTTKTTTNYAPSTTKVTTTSVATKPTSYPYIPSSSRESDKEKCRKDRLPYSFCQSRGYWHPDKYERNNSGDVVTAVVAGVAVGALLSSGDSNAAPAPAVAPTPGFQFINDCKEWVCK